MPKPVSVFYFYHYLLNKISGALNSFWNKAKFYGRVVGKKKALILLLLVLD